VGGLVMSQNSNMTSQRFPVFIGSLLCLQMKQ